MTYKLSPSYAFLQAEFCEAVSALRLNTVPFFEKRSVAFRLNIFKNLDCAVYVPHPLAAVIGSFL